MAKKLTREEMERFLAARDDFAAGIIERQRPPKNTGMVQYLSAVEKVPTRLKLGYTQQLDAQGNPMFVEQNNGAKLAVLEMPQELWEAHQAKKHKRANEPMGWIKSTKSFGTDPSNFVQGESEREFIKYKKSNLE